MFIIIPFSLDKKITDKGFFYKKANNKLREFF